MQDDSLPDSASQGLAILHEMTSVSESPYLQ